jgi:hypothetical protein
VCGEIATGRLVVKIYPGQAIGILITDPDDVSLRLVLPRNIFTISLEYFIM